MFLRFTLFFSVLVCSPAFGNGEIKVNVFGMQVLLPSDCAFFARPSVLDYKIKIICEFEKFEYNYTVYFTKRPVNYNGFISRSNQTVSFIQNEGNLEHYFSNFRREGKNVDEGYLYAICDHEICMKLHYFPTGFERAFKLLEQVGNLNLHKRYIDEN